MEQRDRRPRRPYTTTITDSTRTPRPPPPPPRRYGEARLVNASYPALQLYIEYLSAIPGVDPVVPSAGNGSHLLTYNVFADWDKPKHAPGGPGLPDTEPSALVPPPSKGARGVPSPLIASWAFIKELRWAAQIAATLGYADDAQAYAERARVSGEAFVGAYFRRLKQSSAFSFADDSLTAQAANALGLDLFGTNNSGSEATLSPAQQQQAVTSMVSALDAAANHSIAGIIGQAALYPVLSDFGHVGRALAANVVCTYPSFCDEIENHNATCLLYTSDAADE